MQFPRTGWLGLLAVTVIALYLCWLIVAPFVDVLLWAGVLAIVANPLYRWFLRQRGMGPNLSALLTTLSVVLIIVVPLCLLALAMLRQAVGAADDVQRSAQELLDPNSSAYQFVDRYVDLDQLRDREFLAEKMSQFTGAIAGRTIGLVGGIIGTIVQVIFVLFTMFYLLRDSERIVPAIRDMLPLETDEAEHVLRRTHEVISASIFGVLVIAAVQGTLGGLAFWALGLPSPLLWGVAMFLMSMVPMVGSAIIWGPAAIVLLATGSWIKGIILILWGALVIGTVDNFLRPLIVGEKARLHELIVFFSVLGGLQVFGVLGLVVGPVVVAITLSLIDVLRRASRRAAEPSPAPVIVAPAPPAPAMPPPAPTVSTAPALPPVPATVPPEALTE